jgi:hypothetical protein
MATRTGGRPSASSRSPSPPPPRVHLGDGAQRRGGVIVLRDGRVPEGHDRVADELVDGGAPVDQRLGHGGEVGVHQLHHAVGRHPLGHGGKAAHVDEHHAEVAFRAAGGQGGLGIGLDPPISAGGRK